MVTRTDLYLNKLPTVPIAIRNTLICLLVAVPLDVVIHEVGHALVAYFVYGVSSTITFLHDGFMGLCTPHSEVGKLFGYGGLLEVVVSVTLYLIFRKKLTLDLKWYFWIFIVLGLGYGLYEGMFL
jgi:hypothetical protein